MQINPNSKGETMNRKQKIYLALLFMCAIAGDCASAHADAPVRLEATAGVCKHGLAPDASWSYREWGNYENKMRLNPACYQLGVSYLPLDWDGVKVGIRGAFIDLGRVTADNTFPVDEPEYFRAKDTRTPVRSATGRFHGNGTHKGFSLGLAAETHWLVFDVGAEGGLALLRNTWHVNLPGMSAMVGCREDWACADGNQITPYVGVNARYKMFYVSLRQYVSVHASNCEKNGLFIGLTSGSVRQLTAGVSLEF
jgi:hypothetical protein